ncbi:MAG: SIS domain-containing protein [Puniceicoccales bacterium]|jgi:glucosamine--fructose-6-phosphate aminotransferase (isomerizing)|nr:SIS domain-containing protein [Puniceicoccales bacterium]
MSTSSFAGTTGTASSAAAVSPAATPEKGEFAHFMLKEIFEQPDALRAALEGRTKIIRNGDEVGNEILLDTEFFVGKFEAGKDPFNLWLRSVRLLGHGTSLYAGMVAKYAFEKFTKVLVITNDLAADFRDRFPEFDPAAAKGNLPEREEDDECDGFIAVSQSGETTDTVGAARVARNLGSPVLALCNVMNSTLAREADAAIDVRAGKEVSIASTKAFTNQVAILLALALKFGACLRSVDDGADDCEDLQKFSAALAGIPELAAAVLKEAGKIADIAGNYHEYDDVFFIGRGPLYPAALEGALKLKETACVHSEGYQSAEVKHGPFALLDRRWAVVALAAGEKGTNVRDGTLAVAAECRAQGARVLGVINAGDTEAAAVFDDVIEVPASNALIAPIPVVIALQLFAYNVAVKRGMDIDHPRNLTKAVLVE